MISTLSGALTVSRRQKLLNTAAVHVDDLKSENIQCHKELLSVKDEILSCKNEQLLTREQRRMFLSQKASRRSVPGSPIMILCYSEETKAAPSHGLPQSKFFK